MPKVFTSKTQKIGEIGEKIAEMFLVKHGFTVVERNYTRKWGEIDIICKKDGTVHFIEVKSVSRSLDPQPPENLNNSVSHETDLFRPEENMHYTKIQRLHRTIETYLIEKHVTHETPWQIDLACVYLDHVRKKGKVKLIQNII